MTTSQLPSSDAIIACGTIEPALAEVATGRHAGPEDRRRVDEHVAICASCARALEDATSAWRQLDTWHVSDAVATRAVVVATVRDHLARPPVRAWAIAGGLGLGVAAVASTVLHVRAGVTASAGSLACAAIWAAAFALAFFVVLSRSVVRSVRAALWASAALVGISLVCPAGELMNACDRSEAIATWLGPDRGAFLVGLGYGIIAAAAGIVATRRWRDRGARSAILTVAAVTAFELPVFFMQCQPFAVGVLAATLTGAALASVVVGLGEQAWTRFSGGYS